MKSTNSDSPVGTATRNKSSNKRIPERKNLFIRSVSPETTIIKSEIGREISKAFLVNRLNFINFQEDCIRFHFIHRYSNQSQFISAFPYPCPGTELKCQWIESSNLPAAPDTYQLKHILVPWGGKFILFIPEVIQLNNDGCCLNLPEKGYEFSRRRIERKYCKGISAFITQNGNSLVGTLVDFSASSFRIDFVNDAVKRLESIDIDTPVMTHFYSNHIALFSGECRIIREASSHHTLSYVLESINSDVPHCRKAEFRSERLVLHPSPDITILHPLTQKRLNLKTADLSGSGFSVEEDERSASLLPGLVLPEVGINFAGIFKMTCTAKVVFRKPVRIVDDVVHFRCGLAFIAVQAQDHVKLLGVLEQLNNKCAYICNNVDLEALWDFLFETGFIYPKKYAHIANKKNEIKRTYINLYINSPDIARHFIYQDNGRILGHLATVRFWEKGWLIHHHAARKSAQKKAGMAVLKQFGRFGHNTFRLDGMHMDYLVCYFRPQNRFPNRIFGGVARHIDNPKGCSLDLFAYLNRSAVGDTHRALPGGWELSAVHESDMDALGSWYERQSGGLMLKAFNLDPPNWKKDTICAEFKSHGFKRERHLFALKQHHRLKAIVTVNISDIGLNLSDLTHCINALIIDPEDMAPGILFTSLNMAEHLTGQNDLPALVYPAAYVEKNSIVPEKTYYLWVFHMRTQSQVYYRYMDRLMKYIG